VKNLSSFNTIKSAGYFEETEKRSKFISYCFPVNSESEAADIIKKIKSDHPNARHHVYAYLINGVCERYSDDGEPSGTGGLPILNAIKSANLSNTLVVVVRYFGGILLGTGGLRKMYGSGASNVLNTCESVEMMLCSHICLDVDYNMYSKFISVISKYGAKVISHNYSEKIEIEFLIKKELVERLQKELSDIFKKDKVFEILKEEYCAL